jgi:hypothetical protein
LAENIPSRDWWKEMKSKNGVLNASLELLTDYKMLKLQRRDPNLEHG